MNCQIWPDVEVFQSFMPTVIYMVQKNKIQNKDFRLDMFSVIGLFYRNGLIIFKLSKDLATN